MPIDQLPSIVSAIQSTPGLLKEIYRDLAKPGVSQVGKALSTVLGLGNTILLPLSLLNEKGRLIAEKNMEKYRKQLEAVPEEQIVGVAPEIGVPVTEKLTYVTDEEIGDLYVNLLARASTAQTSGLAHPSFTHVINSLSPDEALVIKALRGGGDLAFIDVQLIIDTATGEYVNIMPLLTGIEKKVALLYPGNCVAYFSNLSGLGIMNVRHDIRLANLGLYKELESSYDEQIKRISLVPEKQRVNIVQGKVEITPYGRLFIAACATRLNET